MLGLAKRNETVAVLFGGRSSEYEISLRSAAFILRSIPSPYRVIPVGITRDGRWLSLEGSFTSKDFTSVQAEDLAVMLEGGAPLNLGGLKAVETLFIPAPLEAVTQLPETTVRLLNLEANLYFPVLHGTNGEDGRLQSVFDLAEVAYVGPDHRTSAIGMDKSTAKRLAERAGIATVKWEEVRLIHFLEKKVEVLDGLVSRFQFPVFVKPNSLGSAIGVSKAVNRQELERALAHAFEFDEKALVEEQAVGTEVECAFLGTATHPRISAPGEIATADFYSYEEKYSSGSKAELFLPARLDDANAQRLRALALDVARALDLEGLSRIDFWSVEQGKTFLFNEVNTLPGMTSISMFPKLWDYEGISAGEWIRDVLDLAVARQRRRTAFKRMVE